MKAVWVFCGCLNAVLVIVNMLTGFWLGTLLRLLGVFACGWLYDQECAT